MSYHHGDLKRALIEAARQELEEAGPDALSLRGVARRADVSHGAPYHHFDGKSDLLARVAEQGFRDLDRAMQQAQERAADTPLERLEATGLGYLEFALAAPAVFKLMFRREFTVAGDDEELGEASSKAFGRLVESVRELHHARGLRHADAVGDAIVAWSTIHGLATLAVEGGLEWLGKDVEALGQMVVRRLAPLFETAP